MQGKISNNILYLAGVQRMESRDTFTTFTGLSGRGAWNHIGHPLREDRQIIRRYNILISSALPPPQEKSRSCFENWITIDKFVQFLSAQTWFLRTEIHEINYKTSLKNIMDTYIY